MKKKVTLIFVWLAIGLVINAQIPQKFKYQAVVRDNQHVILSNQDVGFRMSILKGTSDGTEIYSESQVIKTNPFGIADITIGDGEVVSGVFSDISWGSDNYYLKVEADPKGGSVYEYLGTTQLISVPYALYSGNISSPTRKFTIQEEAGHPLDSALFEVRNADGQTVFAVYPEGTRVNILDEQTKGIKAGFAVGGYNRTGKGVTQEYMRITPDSIRLYFNEESTKGIKGGFAVGGYNRTGKGPIDHYFELKPDSAKFMMVSNQPDELSTNALTVSTRSRFGGDDGNHTNLFNLTLENYFIGHRAGSSNIKGNQNCFFGYESGMENTDGFGNVFLGQGTGRFNTVGDNNVFIGVESGHRNTSGDLNTSVGYQAGFTLTTGFYNSIYGFWAGFANESGNLNTYFGAHAGHLVKNGEGNTYVGAYSGSEDSTGMHNVFVGMRSGSYTGTDFNTILGAYAGADAKVGEHNVLVGADAGRNSSGIRNTFLGSGTGFSNQGTDNIFIGTGAGRNAEIASRNVFIGESSGAFNNGDGNVFIGNNSGVNETGSNTLIIENSITDATGSLLWGRFDSDQLRMNARVGINRTPMEHALEVEGEVAKSVAGDWLVNSDARIKTDVQGVENAFEQILGLHPVKFRYSDEWLGKNPVIVDKEYYNFIAQEFQDVFPDAVRRGGDNLDEGKNLLQMDSYPAQVVAIKAIQELIIENREQQKIIEQLQAENSELLKLQQRIRNLEERILNPIP